MAEQRSARLLPRRTSAPTLRADLDPRTATARELTEEARLSPARR